MAFVFIKIINMSITASWLILAVVLLRALFRKSPRWMMVLLWGLVGLRLVLPVSVESEFCLIPSVGIVEETAAAEEGDGLPAGISSLNYISAASLDDTDKKDETGTSGGSSADVVKAGENSDEQSANADVTSGNGDENIANDGEPGTNAGVTSGSGDENIADDDEQSANADVTSGSDDESTVNGDESTGTIDKTAAGADEATGDEAADYRDEMTGTAETNSDGTVSTAAAVLDAASDGITAAWEAVANFLRIHSGILSVIWLAGTAAVLIYMSVSCILLRARLKTAVLLEGDFCQNESDASTSPGNRSQEGKSIDRSRIVTSFSMGKRSRRRQNIYQSEFIDSPFLLGLLHPRIYLPFSLKEEKMPYVIAHEQAHIARGDHFIKAVGFALLAVHWFNPLVWLAYSFLCKDIEIACDERVIRGMDAGSIADYAEALLMCERSRPGAAARAVLAFGRVCVKKRVRHVLYYKKPAWRAVAMAAAVCLVMSAGFLTNPIPEAVSAAEETGGSDSESASEQTSAGGSDGETASVMKLENDSDGENASGLASGNGVDSETALELTSEGNSGSVKLTAAGYSTSYLEMELTETLTVSAEVPAASVCEGEFGLYRYAKKQVGEDSELDPAVIEATEQLAEAVDRVMGTGYEKQLLTGETEDILSIMNFLVSWSGKYHWFYTTTDYPEGQYTDLLSVYFPFRTAAYDKTLVSEIAQNVAEAFSEFLPAEDYTWECVAVGGELYESMEEFYEEYGLFLPNEGVACVTAETPDAYEIMLRPVLDHGLNYRSPANEGSSNSCLIVFLNSDYEIRRICGVNYVVPEEDAFETVQILPLSDILKKFSEGYSSKKRTTVVKAELCYTEWSDSVRGDYLVPCWVLTYAREGDTTLCQSVYCAVDEG